VSDDQPREDASEPINALHTALLGLFTAFMAVAFLLMLIGDQATARSF
jgi:hypothetical protein